MRDRAADQEIPRESSWYGRVDFKSMPTTVCSHWEKDGVPTISDIAVLVIVECVGKSRLRRVDFVEMFERGEGRQLGSTNSKASSVGIYRPEPALKLCHRSAVGLAAPNCAASLYIRLNCHGSSFSISFSAAVGRPKGWGCVTLAYPPQTALPAFVFVLTDMGDLLVSPCHVALLAIPLITLGILTLAMRMPACCHLDRHFQIRAAV